MEDDDNTNLEEQPIETFHSADRVDDRYLRLLAEFQNYRRRTERERATTAESAKRGIILSLLEVIDDFERALEYSSGRPSPLAEGMNSIYRKLRGILDAEGVAPFQSVGEMFDPTIHEAVASVPTESYAPGVVAQELRRGYRQGDTLLRPARVVVSR